MNPYVGEVFLGFLGSLSCSSLFVLPALIMVEISCLLFFCRHLDRGVLAYQLSSGLPSPPVGLVSSFRSPGRRQAPRAHTGPGRVTVRSCPELVRGDKTAFARDLSPELARANAKWSWRRRMAKATGEQA